MAEDTKETGKKSRFTLLHNAVMWDFDLSPLLTNIINEVEQVQDDAV